MCNINFYQYSVKGKHSYKKGNKKFATLELEQIKNNHRQQHDHPDQDVG